MELLQTTRLASIENEIKALKAQTALGILQIGDRLSEAKKLLPHGQWESWLKNNVEFTPRTARNFIRIAETFSANRKALSGMDVTKLYYLAELPEIDREAFLQTHDVNNMTTRELKKEIDEKRQADILTQPIFDEEMKRAFYEALKTNDVDLISKWHDWLLELGQGVSEIVLDCEAKIGELIK